LNSVLKNINLAKMSRSWLAPNNSRHAPNNERQRERQLVALLLAQNALLGRIGVSLQAEAEGIARAVQDVEEKVWRLDRRVGANPAAKARRSTAAWTRRRAAWRASIDGELPKKVAVCTMVKDQAHALRAWVEFHRLQGVSHFTVYDDNSTDHEQLKWQLRGLPAQVLPAQCRRYGGVSAFTGCQRHSFADCLIASRRAHGPDSWVGLIDVDEYYFAPARNATLASVLQAAADRGIVALGAVSRYFGTSGHHGPCSEMTDVARTHLRRYPISEQEVHPWVGGELRRYDPSTFVFNSKQPWLLLAAAVPAKTRRGFGRIGIHEHPVASQVNRSGGRTITIEPRCHRLSASAKISAQFETGWHDGVWQDCPHRQTVPAWSNTLRAHHYRFHSDECVREKNLPTTSRTRCPCQPSTVPSATIASSPFCQTPAHRRSNPISSGAVGAINISTYTYRRLVEEGLTQQE